METLILLVDTIVVMVVLYFSLKNESRPEGTPELGLFRIRHLDERPKPNAKPAPARRSRRP